MKIIIEVSGGTVTNITATDEVSIYIIDHDELKERCGYRATEDAREAMQPDCICHDDVDFTEELETALADYENQETWEPEEIRV